jgi:hypothetical protein
MSTVSFEHAMTEIERQYVQTDNLSKLLRENNTCEHKWKVIVFNISFPHCSVSLMYRCANFDIMHINRTQATVVFVIFSLRSAYQCRAKS